MKIHSNINRVYPLKSQKSLIYLICQRIWAIKNLLSIYLTSRPLRSAVISFSIIASLAGVYTAIWLGLKFLVGLGGLGSVVIRHLFYLLFFIMFFMVALSSALLYYNSSFRSKETRFLIRLPVDTKEISFLRFIESSILAGWIPLGGFIIFIAAYSKIACLSPAVPLLSPVYVIPFLILSSSFGYLLCVIILKFMNLKGAFIFITTSLLVAVLIFHKPYNTDTGNIFYALSKEVIFFKLSELWFMPFSWAPWAIVSIENGSLGRSLIFSVNLWSLSILSLNLIYSYGGKIFTELFFKYSLPKHKRCYYESFLDKIFGMDIFPVNISSFILKDIKMFIREPALWTQSLIFFGLLFFYFINLQRFSYNLLGEVWKNLIAFLNTFSILCIGSALTIRFVFPQWSMEGRSYWILKLSPVKIRDMLRAKFILSFTGLSFVSIFLIIISDRMLELKPYLISLTVFITAVSIFSLVSFSLGLGAYFADFKREYYLKAVESLGGFIALIIDFGYIIITIFSFTFINHIFIIRKVLRADKYMSLILAGWFIVSVVLSFILLKIGLNKLRSKEY